MVIAILPRRPLPAMFKRPFEFLGIGMPRPAKVTRVSKATREKIIKAASRAFALGGYDGASIRAIVAEADVNQAAINYHFGSKEGLYRAVLQVAVRALMSDGDATESPGTLSRQTALRRFVRGQL